MKFFKTIYHFFDKLEDKVRGRLSHYPIIYTFIGGIAIVLFWRGVWMVADEIPFLNGIVSVIISSVILLITGVFVSVFITDRIILSGVKQEKKIVEKTEEEVQKEENVLVNIAEQLDDLTKAVEQIKEKVETGEGK